MNWVHRKRANLPTSSRSQACLTQAQGISLSMRDTGQRMTSLASTSVVEANGSTAWSLQVSRSEAIIAQPSAPLSWRANQALMHVSALPR